MIPTFPKELLSDDAIGTMALLTYASAADSTKDGEFTLPIENRLAIMWSAALHLADQLLLARGIEPSGYTASMREFGYTQLNAFIEANPVPQEILDSLA